MHRFIRMTLAIAGLTLLSLNTSRINAQTADLIADDIKIIDTVDLFGSPIQQAVGVLRNTSDQAYTEIEVEATAYDAFDQIIGGGFGFIVRACGEAVLPDFTLQPGMEQTFAVTLELDNPAAAIVEVEINPLATPIEATPVEAVETRGITQLTRQETVRLEWTADGTLLHGAGCWRDLFTDLRWSEYNPANGEDAPTTHPKIEAVTEALRRQTGLLDEVYFQHSFLTYAPNNRRMLYQTEINTVVTAEPDGSFKRTLFDQLATRTLQTITWLRDGNFLAAYYGAYGDPVTYFTASVEGRPLSEHPENITPSLIMPGASPSGDQIILANTIDGITGYYTRRAAFEGLTRLFEAEPPGNNWPGPIWAQPDAGTNIFYIALPGEDGPRLTCYNLAVGELVDLAPLPFRLETDERAWWTLSPDNQTIALGASGVHGGLWIIDIGLIGRSCNT
ncbi:MAG TPA: hypothetical protein PLQ56_27125 [Aggregatilineales bacterium]|nr:hypothetical protein [Aggregatilineales bacterium]